MKRSGRVDPDLARVERAVGHFEASHHLFEVFVKNLSEALQLRPSLKPFIHSVKYRIKDPSHLRQKLLRKVESGEYKYPDVDESNLFERIHDLAGIRVIHLHSSQMGGIHSAINEVIDEQKLELVEPPTANCWDIEYEKIFQDIGISPRSRTEMYSTVHYVVRANQKTRISCEIQVRTLMDEVWGEVSHRVNYPDPSTDPSCEEQLKVLARLTTGCTRLVDAIFSSDGRNRAARAVSKAGRAAPRKRKPK